MKEFEEMEKIMNEFFESVDNLLKKYKKGEKENE